MITKQKIVQYFENRKENRRARRLSIENANDFVKKYGNKINAFDQKLLDCNTQIEKIAIVRETVERNEVNAPQSTVDGMLSSCEKAENSAILSKKACAEGLLEEIADAKKAQAELEDGIKKLNLINKPWNAVKMGGLFAILGGAASSLVGATIGFVNSDLIQYAEKVMIGGGILVITSLAVLAGTAIVESCMWWDNISEMAFGNALNTIRKAQELAGGKDKKME